MAAILLLGILLIGCRSTEKKPEKPPSFADRVASAHGAAEWNSNKVLSGRIRAALEGQPLFEANFIHEIQGGRTRMQLPDGSIMIWDGKSAWHSPSFSPDHPRLFHLRTWPRFIAFPFHLQDSGVEFSEVTERTLSAKRFVTSQMTTVDAPRDWHILYADPQSFRLEALACNLTRFSKTIPEEDPKAVTFYDFKRIDGVLLAHDWRLWKWNDTEGLYGTPQGRAVLSDLAFIPLKPGMFDRPAGAQEQKPLAPVP